MELIHTFSLVHDDLPAMDDDDLRRGRPTNHKVFGEAMAILAGDAMTMFAFEIIATDAEPELVAPLVRELSHASGPGGMIGGQVLDMDGENRNLDLAGLQQIHRMKTGALLTTSCRLGAICAARTQPHSTQSPISAGIWVWLFRSWTTCWTSPPRRNNSASKPTKTPVREKIPIRRCWGLKKARAGEGRIGVGVALPGARAASG